MPSENIAVFDLGGTWFRWARYSPSHGLIDPQRVAAISYLSHPHLSAKELQSALTDFVCRHIQEMFDLNHGELRLACISIGAPVNAHDETVLGSGPLWGPSAKPFQLRARLREAVPHLEWQVVNDVTALLAPYMSRTALGKTLLVTVSTGIGSRLYDHARGYIPYDSKYGIQGEIGHLTVTFELDGKIVNRQCECGGRNHLNAFASGRGMMQILNALPVLSSRYATSLRISPQSWAQASDGERLMLFKERLDDQNPTAMEVLDACVSPLARVLAAALSLDPEIDRIVITGGVAHGLGNHYRDALQRTFVRDGLYLITEHDPDYLARRLYWEKADDFGGLRGAALWAQMSSPAQAHKRNCQ
jgi:predicted NBD/HSP70 family sugar kinase